MKKLRLMMAGIALLTVTASLQSCLDDDNDSYNNNVANALVTVVPSTEGTHPWIVLDDSTVAYPVNLSTPPFGNKEVRALINYQMADGQTVVDGKYAHCPSIYVNWVDSILTKNMAKNFGTVAKNDSAYGKDPVEIVNDWVTIAEDGYLTLRFRTRFSSSVKHLVNVVKDPGAKSSYALRFCHNAMGDSYGQIGDGIAAFKLPDLLDTGGKYVVLTLSWYSYSGEKTASFKYCSRKSINPKSNLAEVKYIKMIR